LWIFSLIELEIKYLLEYKLLAYNDFINCSCSLVVINASCMVFKFILGCNKLNELAMKTVYASMLWAKLGKKLVDDFAVSVL
jgi:hypothetical protein